MHLATFTPLLARVALGWGVVLILAMVFLLFGRKRLPELLDGLRKGIREFKKATRGLSDDIAFDAGRSLGGIYGKPAAEALTPENHLSELYDPAVFQKDNRLRRKKMILRLLRILRRIRNFCRRIFQLW